MEKHKKITSLNNKLFSEISIEELNKRLEKEDLDERIQCWTCGCDCDRCDEKVVIDIGIY